MTVFEPTLKMSSYLVGLVVSDFTCINGTADNAGPNGSLPIRVCARPNVPEAHLSYSLDVAIKIIEYFQKLYDVPYPLPQCGLSY
jgi:aminopeptidase N